MYNLVKLVISTDNSLFCFISSYLGTCPCVWYLWRPFDDFLLFDVVQNTTIYTNEVRHAGCCDKAFGEEVEGWYFSETADSLQRCAHGLLRTLFLTTSLLRRCDIQCCPGDIRTASKLSTKDTKKVRQYIISAKFYLLLYGVVVHYNAMGNCSCWLRHAKLGDYNVAGVKF